MSNLGVVDGGDTVRFQKILYNISSEQEDASLIKFSIVDYDNNLKLNASNMSRVAEGKYLIDVYLNSNYSEGLYYTVCTGMTTNGSTNSSFYDCDSFYIESNRLA